MINFVNNNLRLLVQSRKIKNYMCIYFFLFLLFAIVLTFTEFNNFEFNTLINSESSREILITYYQDFNQLELFLEENNEFLESVEYYFFDSNYIINQKSYVINSDIFEEKEYSIRIGFNTDNFMIDDLNIENIKYDDSLEENYIVVNQKLSKYLYSKNLVSNSLITLTLKNYFDFEKILEKLNLCNISFNVNNDVSDTVFANLNLKSIVSIFKYVGEVILISIIFLFSIFYMEENRRACKIYHLVGYTNNRILLTFILNTSFLLLINYIFCFLILFLILSLLFIFKVAIFSCVIKKYCFSILCILMINLLGTIIGFELGKKG